MPGSVTVLLVEDEANLRTATALVLRQAGYHVLEAGSGGQALELAGAHPAIAALVSDIRLPDMYGRRLADRVLELRAQGAQPARTVGIVFMSGNPSETSLDAPLRERERFLAKPFDFDDLLTALESVLRTCAPAPDATRDERHIGAVIPSPTHRA